MVGAPKLGGWLGYLYSWSCVDLVASGWLTPLVSPGCGEGMKFKSVSS